MELIKPDFIIGMIIVVGACEGMKCTRIGKRISMGYMVLALSIIAGFLLAEPFTYRSILAYTFVTFGASTMAYETLIKRLRPPQDAEKENQK